MYIPVKVKFTITFTIATCWIAICTYFSIPWVEDLGTYITLPLAIFIVVFIALVPGFIYMFLLVAYVFDKRSVPKPLVNFPPVTYLIAAYNEEKCIEFTLKSILNQDYKGEAQIIVVDDGSTDNTINIIENFNIKNLLLIKNKHGGKANCLNTGLASAEHDYLICLDADTHLMPTATRNIMERYFSDPPNTAAVAGSIFVKNARVTMMTRMQEWDFFLAITAIKRMQSLLQGTLVAQGAFSLYLKKYVQEVGGWSETVGEDIVLSWKLLQKQYRIGFAEEAISFTDLPLTYKAFFAQRKRWARGLIEAFSQNPRILIVPRLTLLIVYWNLLFPLIDSVFVFAFIPGVILAFMGYFFIAGPMTLAVLPLTITFNCVFFFTQREMFEKLHLKVRRNRLGLIFYILFYQFLLAPAAVAGYISELIQAKKTWGTK